MVYGANIVRITCYFMSQLAGFWSEVNSMSHHGLEFGFVGGIVWNILFETVLRDGLFWNSARLARQSCGRLTRQTRMLPAARPETQY